MARMAEKMSTDRDPFRERVQKYRNAEGSSKDSAAGQID
jgi:hypothetical protein